VASDFIPREDTLALAWMQTFAGGIAAGPALYMLSPADAAAISAAVDAFDVALQVVLDPAERTKVTVAAKDDARRSAEQICRQYAGLIKLNAGVSDPDKIAIGVRPVNTSRDPVPVPQSSPLLNIIAATPGAQTLRYADASTPDKRAKPFGAASLQLFVSVGEAASADPEQAKFLGAYTTNPIGIGFEAGDDGKIATYFARWASRRGDTGPWSAPVSMRIAA